MNDPLMNDPLWTTKTGKTLHASEMSDTHLANSIALIRRRAMEMWLLEREFYESADIAAYDLLDQSYHDMVAILRSRQIPEKPKGRILEL